jgi:hypothetical protein
LLFKNVRAAYRIGGFEEKEECRLLLSGSVLVHDKIVRSYLEQEIKEFKNRMDVSKSKGNVRAYRDAKKHYDNLLKLRRKYGV